MPRLKVLLRARLPPAPALRAPGMRTGGVAILISVTLNPLARKWRAPDKEVQ